MPQSLAALDVHLVFSTQRRAPMLIGPIRPRLFAYIGGTLRTLSSPLIAAGGVEDHVHLLISLGRVTSVADAVRDIKSNSSRWLRTTFPDTHRGFAWQTGYAAFAVSRSQIPGVRDYLARQEEHHRTVTFREEYRRFLERHEVAFDEAYLWD